MGMKLIFLSREDYKLKKIPAETNTDDSYLINEGGHGLKGADGASAILEYCKKENYSHICCATGTGTMMAGLVNNSAASTHITGISVLKNNFDTDQNIQSLLQENKKNFEVIHDYHFGGYAKYQPGLINFMNDFYRQTSIPSDFVYTGKLFYAIDDLIVKDYFPSGSKLLLIQSGGLQGNDSLGKGTLIF
jgi:1-aminocyclopropane-1-carboxylate deaminase